MAANAIELFEQRVAQSRDHVALKWKSGGAWRDATFGDWDRAAREIAAGLFALGIARQDRVALLAQTRAEWVHVDIGALLAGAVTVPIYPSNLSDECAYIIGDSGARVVFVDTPEQLEKLVTERHAMKDVTKVIYFDDRVELARPDHAGRISITLDAVVGEAHRGWVMSLEALRTLGRARLDSNQNELAQVRATTQPEDMLTIVYTSGTTGPPKGVVLTHGSLLWEAEAMKDVVPIGADDLQLLFLPLAHIFARILEWVIVVRGAPCAFASSISALKQELIEVRPTFMCAVPRVLEKIYLGILANRDAAPATKRRVFDWAFSVGRERSQLKQHGRIPSFSLSVQNSIASRLVFHKIHAALGGRMRFIISGGAPLSKEIAEFFHAAGVLVLEGWGLTETSAGTCVNRMEKYRFGTVGPPVPGIELRIAEDGEILVRGGSVMKEYYKRPDATREVLDPPEKGGWFHTGDIGEIEDGFLRITDRKKDIIVTAGGKNVAPQNLENALKATPYISQAMVHGDKRPYLVALITLNEESVLRLAKALGLSASTIAALAREPKIRAVIAQAIDAVNAGAPSYSTIKKFAILPADLSQETGELTPTLKVKRRFTSDKYKAELDALYS